MIDWLTQLICMADLVFLLVLFFTEKNNPSKILLWALVLVFLPFLGFILYIVLGQTFYSDQKFKIKGMNDQRIDDLISQNKDSISASESPEHRRFAETILNVGGLGYSDNNDVKLYTLGEE